MIIRYLLQILCAYTFKNLCFVLKRHPNFVDFYPKCYHGDDKLIVLENLKIEKGYELLDNKKRHDLEAAR